MRYMLAILLLAAATSGPALAQPITAAPPLESTMTLQGDGVVERAPDIAHVAVTIVTNDDVAAQSSSKNNDIFNALKARLNPFGLGADALHAGSYNVRFVPYPPRNLPPEQRQARYGYVTTRYVSIDVSPVENVGKVVDAATAAGVTSVGNISFDLKDRKAATIAALGAAMADLRRTAEAVASAGGVTLLRFRTINVGYNYAQPQMMADSIAMRSAAMPAPAPPTPTDITPSGPIRVTAHINATYVIR